jgi:hypothetical protein
MVVQTSFFSCRLTISHAEQRAGGPLLDYPLPDQAFGCPEEGEV